MHRDSNRLMPIPEPDPGAIPDVRGYEILRNVGVGAMGTVFKARQTSMDRIVALKVLHAGLARDSAFVQRFLREARSAARLNHPNIVQGFDVGRCGDTFYFAMEFVDGPTVGQLLDPETPNGPPRRLDEPRALGIVRAVACALDHAWQKGIVHRDVKPDNIMVGHDGLVKLADLGLARSVERRDRLTFSGEGIFTPDYVSPEQARGDLDLDIRCDIYSLGATLFHMVTGTTPFDGTTATAIAVKHVTEPVPDPRSRLPTLSPGVADLILRMMAKDRGSRPQTPADLIAGLDNVLAALQGTRRPSTGVGPPPPRTHSWVAPTVAAVVALGCIALGAYLFLAKSAADQERIRRERYEQFVTALAEGQRLLAARQWAGAGVAFAKALAIPGHESDIRATEGRRSAQAALAEETRRKDAHGLALDAATDAFRSGDYAKAVREAEAALKEVPDSAAAKEVLSDARKELTLAEQKAKAVDALATGERLAAERRWGEAEAAFLSVLAIPGYDNDTAAKEGVKRSRAGAEDEKRRKAHDRALADARAALIKGDYQAAAREALAALREVPGSPQAVTALAEAQKARELAERKALADSLVVEGERHLRGERWTEAEAAFLKMKGVPGYENDTTAEAGLRAARAAAAVERRKKAHDAALGAARSAFWRGDHETAIREAKSALSELPESSDARNLIAKAEAARAEAERKKQADADAARLEAARRKQADADAATLAGQRRALADAGVAEGQRLLRNGQWAAAEAAFLKVRGIPGYAYDFRVADGLRAARAGWAAEADARKPDRSRTLAAARTALALKQYDRAIEHLTKAIDLFPSDPAPYIDRGHAYERTRDYRRAIEDFTKAIELKPDYALAYSNLAAARLNLGQIEAAIRDANKAIELQPNMVYPYVHRGIARGARGDAAGKVSDCTTAIGLQSDFAPAYNARAGGYYDLKQYDRARQDVRKCLSLAGEVDQWLLTALGMANERPKSVEKPWPEKPAEKPKPVDRPKRTDLRDLVP